MKYIVKALKEKSMKSEQIKHSLSVGIKSIQSRVFDSETDEVISFVKIPIEDSGLVRCEKGTREMNNEPVAWIDPKELDMDVSTSVTKNKQFESDIPLYVQPQKYCPSENNEAYEKGFIDGMAKQRDSAVQRFVESGTPDSELAEHKRIIREQQAEIEALRNRNWDLVSEPWGFDRHSIKELKYMGDDDYYIELCDKQQAEIEALKLQIHTTLTNRNLRTYDGKAQE